MLVPKKKNQNKLKVNGEEKRFRLKFGKNLFQIEIGKTKLILDKEQQDNKKLEYLKKKKKTI